MVYLFLGASNGNTGFTTLLRLDTSFAMAPYALHLSNPVAPVVPLVLRPKPENLLTR